MIPSTVELKHDVFDYCFSVVMVGSPVHNGSRITHYDPTDSWEHYPTPALLDILAAMELIQGQTVGWTTKKGQTPYSRQRNAIVWFSHVQDSIAFKLRLP